MREDENRIVELARTRSHGAKIEQQGAEEFATAGAGDAATAASAGRRRLRPRRTGRGLLSGGARLSAAGAGAGQAGQRAHPRRRAFDAGGPFDPGSNYLFGEGGAGTFSDGKLTCRATGPDVHRVLELFAECKGKPSILYEHGRTWAATDCRPWSRRFAAASKRSAARCASTPASRTWIGATAGSLAW